MRSVVFSRAWFARYQRVILAALAMPVIGRELREALAIRRGDIGYDGRIVRVWPHAYLVANPDRTYTIDVRTHVKYAKRLRHEYAAIWRAAHGWDRYVANPLIPALNVGFDTLDARPDPDPEVTTVDGIVARTGVSETWATIRAGAGTFASDSETQRVAVRSQSTATLNLFVDCYRTFLLFDTSPVGGSATIGAAVASVFEAPGGVTQQFSGASPIVDVYTTTLASNTAISTSDFGNIGSISQTGSGIAFGSITASAYNDFTLNGTGRGNVNATGVSAFGLREATYDAGGTTWPWEASKDAAFTIWFADQTGSANDPKLVVTFTRPASIGFPYEHLRAGDGSTSGPRVEMAPVIGKFSPGIAR